MNITKKINFQLHPFHFVSPSHWPINTSFSLLMLTTSVMLTMYGISSGLIFIFSALFSLVASMFFWFRDIISKATYLGNHTLSVQRGINRGIPLFKIITIAYKYNPASLKAFNSLHLLFNSPPKPHSFYCLPLQSSIGPRIREAFHKFLALSSLMKLVICFIITWYVKNFFLHLDLNVPILDVLNDRRLYAIFSGLILTLRCFIFSYLDTFHIIEWSAIYSFSSTSFSNGLNNLKQLIHMKDKVKLINDFLHIIWDGRDNDKLVIGGDIKENVNKMDNRLSKPGSVVTLHMDTESDKGYGQTPDNTEESQNIPEGSIPISNIGDPSSSPYFDFTLHEWRVPNSWHSLTPHFVRIWRPGDNNWVANIFPGVYYYMHFDELKFYNMNLDKDQVIHLPKDEQIELIAAKCIETENLANKINIAEKEMRSFTRAMNRIDSLAIKEHLNSRDTKLSDILKLKDCDEKTKHRALKMVGEMTHVYAIGPPANDPGDITIKDINMHYWIKDNHIKHAIKKLDDNWINLENTSNSLGITRREVKNKTFTVGRAFNIPDPSVNPDKFGSSGDELD